MPPYSRENRRDYAPTSNLFHKAEDKGAPSPTTPAAVTGIEYPSPLDERSEYSSVKARGHMARPFYNHHNIASSDIGDASPAPGPSSLAHIWSSIRNEKEHKMAKERPKVQSLEKRARELDSSEPSHIIQIPVQSQGSASKSLKKQKSICTIRESTDGRSLVATYDMPPGVTKQDIHLSFQRNRVVVTWGTVETLEWEEDGVIMRERIERHYNRTLPLPEGTRFEEIQAVMNNSDRKLVIRYPNMRCFRIDGRSRSGDS